jgi:AsmA protein
VEYRVKNPLKIILSIIAALILFVVLGVCAAVFFINPNNYKPEFIAAVKNQTGRDLGIEGDLKLVFFPALGLSSGKMTLSNATGFEHSTFASLEESRINVELLPLLSKKIEISRVVLTGLTLNLAKNQQGVGNWEDLTANKTPIPANTANSSPSQQQVAAAATVGTAAVLSSFSVGAVTIENSQVNWQNLQTGKNLVIKDLKLNTDKASFNQPVSVDLAYVVDNAESKITQTVKLSTLLEVNEKLDSFALSHFSVTLTRQCLAVNEQLLSHGNLQTFTSSLTIADSRVSLTQPMFKVTGLQLKAGDLTLDADGSAEHLQDNPVFQGKLSVAEFNFTKFLKDFAIPTPVMGDATALNKLAISVNFSGGKNSLDLQDMNIKLDGSTISGSTNIKNFSSPSIAFNLAIDSLDVDRYLSPAEKSKQTNLSPLLALTAGAAMLPVELLRQLDANGDLAVGSLKFNGMNLQDLHLHVSAKDGLVNTSQTVKQFYQGEFASNFNVDARNPQTVMAVDQKFDHVQIEPFLTALGDKATIRGTLDSSLQLNAHGNTQAELQSTLNGQLKFLCKDGAILGFSLQNMIDKGKSLLNGTDPAANVDKKETPFVFLGGSAVIAKGLVTNDDLQLKTNKAQATGKGTVNLLNEQLNYKLTALLPKDSADPADVDLLHNTPIVIAVGGTISKPTYTLDVTSLVTNKTKEKVENLVNELQTDEGKAKIEKALDKLKPEEKEKIKELAPKIGKLFKKLF